MNRDIEESRFSNVGDLTELIKKVESIVKDHFNEKERPVVALAFSLPKYYSEAHWATNVPRDMGIFVFEHCAHKMREQNSHE